MLDLYATLGPRCSDVETLAAMFDAGMTGVRLNLSHVSLRSAEPQIRNLRAAAAHCGREPRLLIDLQGPELRIGTLDSAALLKEGEEIRLGDGGIPIPPMILPALRSGQRMLLDDGMLELAIVRADAKCAAARVVRGGTLRSRKSIALPGLSLHPPTLTANDLQNISLAGEYGVTGVMQPFVRDRQDLENVRAALRDAGAEGVRLFAKIENRDGLDNLPELIRACDEIVVARGDLGNAVALWELPRVQKEIAAACRDAGRPFMVVTQMLASMEHSPVPTRAELSDVFNAVCDGAASVMVTGETAVGEYPVEVMRYLAATAGEALHYVGRA